MTPQRRVRLEKPRNGETWKSRAVDLAERFQKSQDYIEFMRRAMFELTSAKLLFRSHTRYASEFGSMWYLLKSGAVIECNHQDQQAHTWDSLQSAIDFYAESLSAPNKAIHAQLLAVSTERAA